MNKKRFITWIAWN